MRIDLPELDPHSVDPKSRWVAVLMGTITWSSWLDALDDDVEPTVSSTPTTVMGTPVTLTVWPTGSNPLNSSEAVSAPSTATAV